MICVFMNANTKVFLYEDNWLKLFIQRSKRIGKTTVKCITLIYILTEIILNNLFIHPFVYFWWNKLPGSAGDWEPGSCCGKRSHSVDFKHSTFCPDAFEWIFCAFVLLSGLCSWRLHLKPLSTLLFLKTVSR